MKVYFKPNANVKKDGKVFTSASYTLKKTEGFSKIETTFNIEFEKDEIITKEFEKYVNISSVVIAELILNKQDDTIRIKDGIFQSCAILAHENEGVYFNITDKLAPKFGWEKISNRGIFYKESANTILYINSPIDDIRAGIGITEEDKILIDKYENSRQIHVGLEFMNGGIRTVGFNLKERVL